MKGHKPDPQELNSIIEMHDALREVVAARIASASDVEKATQHAMIALQSYSGVLFGQLIGAGLVEASGTRRGAEAAAQNFRQGVKVGQRRAARLIRDGIAGTVQ